MLSKNNFKLDRLATQRKLIRQTKAVQNITKQAKQKKMVKSVRFQNTANIF